MSKRRPSWSTVIDADDVCAMHCLIYYFSIDGGNLQHRLCRQNGQWRADLSLMYGLLVTTENFPATMT
jgi:hypothetical protein